MYISENVGKEFREAFENEIIGIELEHITIISAARQITASSGETRSTFVYFFNNQMVATKNLYVRIVGQETDNGIEVV